MTESRAAATTTPATGADAALEAAAGLLAHRPMLLGLAYRLLGSLHDADDVLQDAYLRWLRTDRTVVAEPRRYLSRIVARLALDRLRAHQAAKETYVGPWLPEPVPTASTVLGPLETAEQRDSLSLAMLHLLERLSPPERAVFVLRTAFEWPYAEIADLLGRSTEDCRQLHRRARARLQHDRPRFTASRSEQKRLLHGFLAAARDGDLPALTRMMTADAAAWSDGGGRVRAARNPIFGGDKVARFFAGIYSRYSVLLRADPVEVNVQPALVIRYGPARHVLAIAAHDGAITGLFLIANPDKLAHMRP
ncbi:MAG TPA: RNA polymerase sigma factor SigJ [Micromonospora sp.]|nr:RNA polymerase sigma factor SigJ [Micromonospora sp.]